MDLYQNGTSGLHISRLLKLRYRVAATGLSLPYTYALKVHSVFPQLPHCFAVEMYSSLGLNLVLIYAPFNSMDFTGIAQGVSQHRICLSWIKCATRFSFSDPQTHMGCGFWWSYQLARKKSFISNQSKEIWPVEKRTGWWKTDEKKT